MVLLKERNLIFGIFLGVGVFIVGLVSYRVTTAPLPRNVEAMTSSVFDRRTSPDRASGATPRNDIPVAAAATPAAYTEANTAVAPPPPSAVTPLIVRKPEPERETMAMLPAPASPTRQVAPRKRGETKTAQLDICAKHGMKREYYTKGKGKYWRCR
jgi:hypothetical protein